MNYFKFSNKEIREIFVDYVLSRRKDITEKIRFLSNNGYEIDSQGEERIGIVVFDGMKEELFVNFFPSHVSVFVKDKEIMFIDESSINTFTSSDIADNVVYEGNIIDIGHRNFLEILANIILCFIDLTDIVVEYVKDSKYLDHKYFEAYRYRINIVKQSEHHGTYEYGNISFFY